MIMQRRSQARTGFTLIELMAVVLILAVLSAVAMPRFFDYQAQASRASVKGTLGGVRAGIANYYANAAVTTGTAAYPTITELTDGSTMQEVLPENPYKDDNGVEAATQVQAANRSVIVSNSGWAYYDGSLGGQAVFYANSSQVGENTF